MIRLKATRILKDFKLEMNASHLPQPKIVKLTAAQFLEIKKLAGDLPASEKTVECNGQEMAVAVDDKQLKRTCLPSIYAFI